MFSERGVKLARNTARRVFEATRYYEQSLKSKAPPLSGPVDFGGAIVIKITTATTRMMGANPGYGYGIIQSFNGSSFSNSSSQTYKILNPTSNAFAVGAYVTCVSAYGFWSIVNVDKCSNVS